MANAFYPLWKKAIMSGTANSNINVNTATDGPHAVLVDTGAYTYNASHQYYSSLTAGIVGSAVQMTNPVISNTGNFDADDITFTGVTGTSVESLVVFRKNSGANTTWQLVAFLDSGTGISFTPNGGDVIVTWNASGLFDL